MREQQVLVKERSKKYKGNSSKTEFVSPFIVQFWVFHFTLLYIGGKNTEGLKCILNYLSHLVSNSEG